MIAKLTSKWRGLTMITLGLLMSGCMVAVIPQQERLFRDDLSRSHRVFLTGSIDRKNLTKGERAQLETARHRSNAKNVGFEKLGLPNDEAPFAGYGFVGHKADAYAVYRDGAGVFFPHGMPEQELEKFAPRLRSTFVAGTHRQRIVGQAPRGTMTSWNVQDPNQNLLIRPQQATFDQKWALHSTTISNGKLLAVAAENRALELWSLSSGDLERQLNLPDNIQPRAIMPGGHRDAVVFGTEKGEVRLWRGRRDTELLYKHYGPVTSIRAVSPTRLASVARDGHLMVFDYTTGSVIGEVNFPRSVYELYVSGDYRFVVAVPAQGSPIAFDLDKLESIVLSSSTETRFSGGTFGNFGQFFMARGVGGNLFVWDLETGRKRAVLIPKPHKRGRKIVLEASREGTPAKRIYKPGKYADRDVVDFKVIDTLNLLVVASDGHITYFDLESLKPKNIPLVTDQLISGIEISQDENYILIALANGQLVRMRVLPKWITTVEMDKL